MPYVAVTPASTGNVLEAKDPVILPGPKLTTAEAAQQQGTVRIKGKRFEATVRINGIGRPRKSFAKEADAWAWIAAVKTDASRGEYLAAQRPPKGLRFDDLCRLYRVHKVTRWREGTIRFFDGHLKTTLIPHFGKRAINSITPDELQRFIDSQLGRVAPGTVNKYFQLLGQVLNYAVRMRYLDRSPMLGVERGKVEPTERRILRPHELRAILEASDPDDRAFFAVLTFCGLRRGEAFRCEWDWIDFENDMLNVKVAKRGSNKIPLSSFVKKSLMELGPTTGPVFLGRYHRTEDYLRFKESKQVADMRKAPRRALEAARIDPTGISFHTFRHSFITLVEQISGVSYSVARALARHGTSSTDITARYLHPSQNQLRWALIQLEQRVFETSNVVPFRQVGT